MSIPQFVSSKDALDIVFADRNKNYGAYQLRRAYPRHLRSALSIGFLLLALGIGLPDLLSAISNKSPESPAREVIAEPGPPPDIDADNPPPPPPPPPPTPPPPVRATIRFVPPSPTPDELVQDEQPPTQEDVLNAAAEVGATTRASEGDAPPTLRDVPDFPREVENSKKTQDDGEYNMVTVQKPPTFPGGEQDLLRYLAENIKYPALAREAGIEGTVALSFVVNKDGSVTDVSILKDIGGGCGKEAVRVVKSMPRWAPGEANGHPVKVRFTLPVRFRLQ
ncbi:MAG: TonB family protein [Saprospiraceae bacterium]|nr:TonB family protein [Saprospiraceae bacterium]